MYHDLVEMFWFKILKKDIAEFVAKCPNGQNIKAKHQKSGGFLHEIEVPTLKWEDFNYGFCGRFCSETEAI